MKRSLAIFLVAVVFVLSGTIGAESMTYTLDADFDLGTLLNVNHDAPNNNQLQLNTITTPFPFVNVSASGRGTIQRIDANTGAILGEFQTAPDGMGRNPSRTTVDLRGNVWVANRDEFGESPAGSGIGKGSVARVGLIVGGTRSDADGTPNPAGQYLKPPFQYNTCVDRDGDNLIKTSSGLDNVLPWTNTGGADTHGGVSTAEDECIINYTRVVGMGTRTVAVDPNNDVWVGGIYYGEHEKLSGVTGQPIPGTQINFGYGCGGYGGLVDKNNVLWSSSPGGPYLLRFDANTMNGACLYYGIADYGLGIDPNTGDIWHTSLYGDLVAKIAPDGTLLNYFNHGTYYAQGVTVDGNSNVWVASSLYDSYVSHLRTDGTFVGNLFVGPGYGPTGVSVDANGKIWATNYNGWNAVRIDPNAGDIGGGGFPVGAVDLTVDLGFNAYPYNYSDMTGFVSIGSTSPQGSWTVIQDSGKAGNEWGVITWNTELQRSEPAGTSIVVEARAADTEAGLSGQTFIPVLNGVPFLLTGQFIEVRATLKASLEGISPVLSDITINVLALPVPVDIRPGGCPNPLSTKELGVLPVAIAGTATLDVTQIDPASVRLEGVAPLRSSLMDVATPYEPYTGKVNVLDCTMLGPDGFVDLVLQFDAPAIIAALVPFVDGQVRVLKLTGNLKPEFGGRPIVGEDVVVIQVPPGRPPR